MKVLWLASWYPDEYEPTNGDFIQRHAKATAQLMHVDLIHVAQAGKDRSFLHKVVVTDDGSLHEIRVKPSMPDSELHVFVRLFAQFGAPEYHVLLGPADPAFVASAEWPRTWGVDTPSTGD